MRNTTGRSPSRSVATVGTVLTMAAFAGCGAESTRAGQARAEFRTYCEKTLAIETYPEPEIDYDSLTSDQLKTENKTFAATLMPLAEQVRVASPAKIRSDVDVLADAVKQVSQTGDFDAAFDTPAVETASGRTHAFDLENCGWAKIDVSGKDYAFRGIPKKVEAGPVSFEFTNSGTEPHELVLYRVNDGVKESFKEILALPEEQGMSKMTPVGGTFAPPGEGDHAVANLTKGRYGVACFVPVGGGEDGPPHVTKGMHAEFEVT